MKELMTSLLAILKFLFKLFLPPKMYENGDKDRIYQTQLYEQRKRQWERTVGWTLLCLMTATILSCGMSWGWTPWYTGFELRTEAQVINQGILGKFNQVLARQNQSLALDIARQIDAKLKISCNTKDPDLKIEISQEINGYKGLEKQYFKLTDGQGYRQASCSELLGEP